MTAQELTRLKFAMETLARTPEFRRVIQIQRNAAEIDSEVVSKTFRLDFKRRLESVMPRSTRSGTVR